MQAADLVAGYQRAIELDGPLSNRLLSSTALETEQVCKQPPAIMDISRQANLA